MTFRLCAVLAALVIGVSGCRQAAPVSSADDAIEATAVVPQIEQFCRDAHAFVVHVVDIAKADWNHERVRALYEDLESFLRRAAEVIPEHLRPGVMLAATVLSAFRTSLETAGYDLARIDPSAWATVNSPEFSAALVELAAYSRRTCGLPG